VARYRAGDISGSIRDLQRSIDIGGFDARAGFFLAAAHAQAGDAIKASTLFDEAEAWMRANQTNAAELRRFREEAAATLYMATHKPANTSARSNGAATKKLRAAPAQTK
jgi:hypothetical protein